MDFRRRWTNIQGGIFIFLSWLISCAPPKKTVCKSKSVLNLARAVFRVLYYTCRRGRGNNFRGKRRRTNFLVLGKSEREIALSKFIGARVPMAWRISLEGWLNSIYFFPHQQESRQAKTISRLQVKRMRNVSLYLSTWFQASPTTDGKCKRLLWKVHKHNFNNRLVGRFKFIKTVLQTNKNK